MRERHALQCEDNRVFHPQDFRVQLPRELLSVRVAFAQLREMYRRLDRAFAAEVDEMGHEGHVLPVANLMAHVAVFERIFNQACR